MAVKHVLKDGKVLCGMKPKKNDLLIADKLIDVTCKKCLKKLDAPVKKAVEPKVDVMADIEDLDSEDELKDGDDLFPGIDKDDEDMWPEDNEDPEEE